MRTKRFRTPVERLKSAPRRSERTGIGSLSKVVFVPGGEGRTFDDVSDDLDDAESSSDYAEVFSELMEACGLDSKPARPDVAGFVVIRVTGGDANVDLFFPGGELLQVEDIERVRSEQGIVVLRTPTAPGAFMHDSKPSRVRFLQPEHILSVVASLIDARGSALESVEIIETLSQVFVSSVDPDRWFLATSDGISGPPPFTGDLPALDATFAVPHADDDTMG